MGEAIVEMMHLMVKELPKVELRRDDLVGRVGIGDGNPRCNTHGADVSSSLTPSSACQCGDLAFDRILSILGEGCRRPHYPSSKLPTSAIEVHPGTAAASVRKAVTESHGLGTVAGFETTDNASHTATATGTAKSTSITTGAAIPTASFSTRPQDPLASLFSSMSTQHFAALMFNISTLRPRSIQTLFFDHYSISSKIKPPSSAAAVDDGGRCSRKRRQTLEINHKTISSMEILKGGCDSNEVDVHVNNESREHYVEVSLVCDGGGDQYRPNPTIKQSLTQQDVSTDDLNSPFMTPLVAYLMTKMLEDIEETSATADASKDDHDAMVALEHYQQAATAGVAPHLPLGHEEETLQPAAAESSASISVAPAATSNICNSCGGSFWVPSMSQLCTSLYAATGDEEKVRRPGTHNCCIGRGGYNCMP
jgi:hypothetical protein